MSELNELCVMQCRLSIRNRSGICQRPVGIVPCMILDPLLAGQCVSFAGASARSSDDSGSPARVPRLTSERSSSPSPTSLAAEPSTERASKRLYERRRDA